MPHGASDADTAGLLERQDHLQSEADAVLADLDLLALLEPIGLVLRVGSSVLGLMASRDIDLHVYPDEMDGPRAFGALRPLAAHPRVQRLRLSAWTGPFRVPELPEGYSWGLRYYTDAGDEWKLDVWFFAGADPRAALDYAEDVRRRLTPETRLAILEIKAAHGRHPAYRGAAVYEAVLDRGVRTPEEFGALLEGPRGRGV